MEVYLALLVPILMALVALFLFARKVAWWETLLPIVVSLICIFCIKGCMEGSNTKDVQYLSSYVLSATYEEEWNEYIKKTCTERYACGTKTTGSGKHRHTTTKYCTRHYDCSYVEYHPAKWYVTDAQGHSYYIAKDEFDKLCIRWKNKTFVDMHRRYHTIDGDEYVTRWDADKNTLWTTHWAETYENKTQAASSIYNFEEVDTLDKREYQTYDYPELKMATYFPCILSKHYPVYPQEQDYFNSINGLLGKKKQVQAFVCIYKGVSEQAAHYQEAYWKGGNKNEIDICIGVDNSGLVKWCKVFTWSESSICEIKIRDWVLDRKGKKLDFHDFTDFTFVTIEKDWLRKDFSDFEYLQVDLTPGQVALVWIITSLVSLLCVIFSVMNEFDSNIKEHDGLSRFSNKIKQHVVKFIKKVHRKR